MQEIKLSCKGIFIAIQLLISVTLLAQPGNRVIINGIVQDAAKNPLTGVAVAINNKSIAVTDLKGKFDVTVDKGSKITFTSVSFQSFVYHATDNAAGITIILERSVNTLDSVVVVTALGITRKERSLGYAATTVQGEQLTEAMPANWTDALSGKVAGLSMIRSGSGPTASNKIILRGENNLTGDNEALICTQVSIQSPRNFIVSATFHR